MKNKYGAKRTHFAGEWFDSGAESDCYALLKLLEKAGELKEIERQSQVYLTRARIGYRVDFKVFDLKLNEVVWVEYKGLETPEFRIKKKLWKHYGPGRLRIYKGRGMRMIIVEEIIPAVGAVHEGLSEHSPDAF